MKNKTNLLIILIVFVLLIAGASILYNKLGQSIDTQQMIIHQTQHPVSENSTAAPSSESSTESSPDNTDETPSSEQPPSEQENPVFLAPDFCVYDREGNTVHLSDFFGKPIVLNFWASWCGPCQSEMPDFQAKYSELGDKINFMMVNVTVGRETLESATAFIDRSGYDLPVFYDLSSEASIIYNANALPTSYFINADGHLIAQAIGALSAEDLQIGIDMIID